MRDRRVVVAAVAMGLLAAGAHHPTIDFRFQTHEAADPSPRRFQAAIDLGLVGVSVLYTWTVHRLR